MKTTLFAVILFLIAGILPAQDILNLPVAKYTEMKNTKSNHCVIIHIAKPNVIEVTIDWSQSEEKIDSVIKQVTKDAVESMIDQCEPEFKIWNHEDLINNEVPDEDREYGNALFVKWNGTPSLLTAGHCFPKHESYTELNYDAVISMHEKYISKLPLGIILPDIARVDDACNGEVEIVSYHHFGGKNFKKGSLKGKMKFLRETDVDELLIKQYELSDMVNELSLALDSMGTLAHIKEALGNTGVSGCNSNRQVANRIILARTAAEFKDVEQEFVEVYQALMDEYVIRVPDKIFAYSAGHSGSGVVYNDRVVAVVSSAVKISGYKLWVLEPLGN